MEDQMDLRDEMAEAIWRAEYRRAASKERLITWEEAGPDTQGKYLFVSDSILALPELQRIIAIAKDYDSARLGHTT